MINQKSPKCFISYSSLDKPVAARLADKLKSRGIDVWVDTLQILPGDSLVQKIFEEGLKDCQLFLALLSPYSVKSEWLNRIRCCAGKQTEKNYPCNTSHCW